MCRSAGYTTCSICPRRGGRCRRKRGKRGAVSRGAGRRGEPARRARRGEPARRAPRTVARPTCPPALCCSMPQTHRPEGTALARACGGGGGGGLGRRAGAGGLVLVVRIGARRVHVEIDPVVLGLAVEAPAGGADATVDGQGVQGRLEAGDATPNLTQRSPNFARERLKAFAFALPIYICRKPQEKQRQPGKGRHVPLEQGGDGLEKAVLVVCIVCVTCVWVQVGHRGEQQGRTPCATVPRR